MDMQILKVRIRAGDASKGEDQLMYPALYDPALLDRKGLSSASIQQVGITMSGDVGRGGSEEWCFIMLPLTLATEWAKDPDIEICNRADCDTEMEKWRINNAVPELRYDEEVVNAISAKQSAGITQTAEQKAKDKDALDSTKPDRGIRKMRRNVADIALEKGITIKEPATR